MKRLLMIFLGIVCIISAHGQKSVFSPWAVNSQIKNSIDEGKRNDELLPNQETNTVLENENKKKTNKLKKKLDQLKQRFEKFSIIIDVFSVGQEAARSISKINTYQSYIINDIKEDPSLVNALMEDAVSFVKQSESLVRYLVAVSVSYNQIMGMDNADRKVVMNFIISELRSIEQRAQNMYVAVKRRKMNVKLRSETFKYYVNKDIQLVKDIIKNAKDL